MQLWYLQTLSRDGVSAMGIMAKTRQTHITPKVEEALLQNKNLIMFVYKVPE